MASDLAQLRRRHVDRQFLRLLLVIVVVGASFTVVDPAFATFVQVHAARENYYSTGGTKISSCSGEGCVASAWSVGDVTGQVMWHAVTKIFKDTETGQTRFQYTVTNDLYTNAITGLHVGNNTKLGTGTTPTGWTFSQNEMEWASKTGTASSGVAQLSSKIVLTVTLGELVPIVFTNSTGIDFVTGCTAPCYVGRGNWMIASGGPLVPHPEPATLLLVGTGLAAGGVWTRKRLSKRPQLAEA
jgi:hypothetical protein